MTQAKTDLTPEQVAALGARHVEREGACDLEALMDTLNDDPLYEYPALRKRFRGRDKARRFYEFFFEHFSPNVIDTRLVNEWANATSVTQEYDVTLSFDGVKEQHRILGVLFVVGDKLGGETVYASEATVRRMIGPIFDELESY